VKNCTGDLHPGESDEAYKIVDRRGVFRTASGEGINMVIRTAIADPPKRRDILKPTRSVRRDRWRRLK